MISNVHPNEFLPKTPSQPLLLGIVKNEADMKMSPRTLLPSCSLSTFADLTDVPLPKKMRKESMVHLTDAEFAPLPRLAGKKETTGFYKDDDEVVLQGNKEEKTNHKKDKNNKKEKKDKDNKEKEKEKVKEKEKEKDDRVQLLQLMLDDFAQQSYALYK